MRTHFAIVAIVAAGFVSQPFDGVYGSAKPTVPTTAGESSVNRVLHLDGESDFMRVPDSPSLHAFTNAITIEAWFKASSFYPDDGQVNSLVRKDVLAGEEDFLLRFRTADGEPRVEMSPGSHIGALGASHAFKVGRWYHLAGTYDGSTITAYVNGTRIGSESASGRMYIDKADLYIGKGDPDFSYGEYFHGALDEIRLWNVARSAEEIRAGMGTTLTAKEKGLVAYWNFDDGTTRDLSGHGHNGLLPQIVESSDPASSAAMEQTADPATAGTEGTTTAVEGEPGLPDGRRERARDRIVHIEEGILREIPDAPRLCDQMDARKEKVDIGDCKLYCENEGSGTPVVLLHGGPGATHHHYHPHFSQAAGFARVIYYDQRGCGLSDYEPGEGYSIDQAVDDLDRLRQALGIDQWVVLGHSFGGLLAQCYTMKYPENLKGLVLVCASTGLHGQSMPSRARQFISRQEREKMSEIRRTPGLSTAQLIYNNFLNGDWKRQSYYKPSRERIAQIVRYEWVHDNNFNSIMSRSIGGVNLEGVFAQCPIPTLIIEGRWDMSWNTDKPGRFQKNHPHAKLIMLEESGHSCFEDEPEKFFGALEGFMASLSQVSTESLTQWKSDLAEQREEEDPLLAGTMSPEEAQAIEEFRRIKATILTGGHYEDASTPLHAALTFLSSREPGKAREYFMGLDILRAPLPPDKPEEATLWPVYACHPGSKELADTFVLVYSKGKWIWIGNMGQGIDWRPHRPTFQQWARERIAGQ